MANEFVTAPMVVRMKELRAAELSAAAVAKVIQLEFGKRPSVTTVARYAPAKENRHSRPRDEFGQFA